MSTGTLRGRVQYEEALQYATEILEQLRPHCVRIEIAGSIRRKCKWVNDIEIIAIPKPYDIGLFESGLATVVNRWEKVKGDLPCKYTQRIPPCGMKLDLFLVTELNYGYQLAIRTGSADFSHKVLARGWCRAGYRAEGGILYGTRSLSHKVLYIREEADLFHLIGLKFIPPEERN